MNFLLVIHYLNHLMKTFLYFNIGDYLLICSFLIYYFLTIEIDHAYLVDILIQPIFNLHYCLLKVLLYLDLFCYIIDYNFISYFFLIYIIYNLYIYIYIII